MSSQPLTLVPSAFWATAVAELELFCLVAVLVSVLMSPLVPAITLAKSTEDGLRLAVCCACTAVAALEEETVLIVMVYPSDGKEFCSRSSEASIGEEDASSHDVRNNLPSFTLVEERGIFLNNRREGGTAQSERTRGSSGASPAMSCIVCIST